MTRSGSSVDWTRFLVFAPIYAAALVVWLANAAIVVAQLRFDGPRSPWEAGLTVEAARVMRGLPMYESVTTGHATTMYGFVGTYLTAPLQAVTGFDNATPRIVSLLCAVAVVAILVVWLGWRSDGEWTFVAASLLVGANARCLGYFTDGRPDLIALLFSFGGLVFFDRWDRERRAKWLVAGSVLVVMAFLTKQPSVLFSLVPPLAMLFRGRPTDRRALVASLLPFACILATLVVIRLGFPYAYHSMFAIPASYSIPPSRVVAVAANVVTTSGLFIVALVVACFRKQALGTPRARCLLACVALSIPAGILAAAKWGGGANSLLPATIAMGAFCGSWFPELRATLEAGPLTVARRFALSCLAAGMLLAFAFPDPLYARDLAVLTHGDESYAAVVQDVRALGGTTVCLEDPTIPLHANGTIGRSIFFETDAALWPKQQPDYFYDELAAADNVVVVQGGFQHLVAEERLRRAGFEPRGTLGGSSSVYYLWQRAETAPR